MKRLYCWLIFWACVLAIFLLCIKCSEAQTTSTTATVVDSDSTVWVSGTVTVEFVPSISNPNPAVYKINGAPLSPSITKQTATLNGSGVFTLTVYDNTQVTPIGSSWRYTVCPLATSKCGILQTTIAGSSVNLSSAINAIIPAPRFQPISGAYGYADVEAVLQLIQGSTYWNVTTAQQEWYNGTTWQTGAGGGGPPTGTAGGDLTGTYPNPTVGNITPSSNVNASNSLRKLEIGGGGGPVPCAGVINDACPDSGGTSSHMACSGSVGSQSCTCTAGTGPTDNQAALNVCASTPGDWGLPTQTQGSKGWIYTSATIEQNISGNILEGYSNDPVNNTGGNPQASSTVIETLASSNIDAINQNCGSSQCIGSGVRNLFITAVTSGGSIATATPSNGFAFRISPQSVPNAYTAYDWLLDNVSASGYGGNSGFTYQIYGATKGKLNNVNAQINSTVGNPGSGGLIIEGAGIESNIFTHFRAVGNSHSTGCGLQVGGSTTYYSSTSYFDDRDSSYVPSVCFGTATDGETGWFDFAESEFQPGPNQIGNNSHLAVRWAGDQAYGITNGSLFQMHGNGSLNFLSPTSVPYTAQLASETITAGTPTTGTGSLPAATYFYEVSGVDPLFNCTVSTTHSTLPSNEVSQVLNSPGSIIIPLTYATTVNGYPGIALFRGTSTGTETCLHVFWNATSSVTDNGTYGTPSGSLPSVSGYYHPAFDLAANDQAILNAPAPYVQLVNSGGPTASTWLSKQSDGELYFADPFPIYVRNGLSATLGYQCRGAFYYFMGLQSSSVADGGPRWCYWNGTGYSLTPALTNPTGNGSVVLANAPTTNGLNDIGNSSFNNATCSGTCTGFGTSTSVGTTLLNGPTLGGIGAGTYTSGGSIAGTATQTCILTFANGGTATVPLTGTNVIAGGTAYSITAAGSNTTANYTTATLSSGSAICSGTAVVIVNLANSVAGTGSNQVIYTITVPTLAAGQCIAYKAGWESTGATNTQQAYWELNPAGPPTTLLSLNVNSATLVPITSTVHICNNPGVTTSQIMYTDPVILAENISGQASFGTAALNFSSPQTLEFLLNYVSGFNYYPMMLQVEKGY
jgi:hypothetical protein